MFFISFSFSLFFFLSLSCALQSWHYTQSSEELGCQKKGTNIEVYNVDSCPPYKKSWRERGFVNVINQGTPSFTKTIHNIMDRLPYQEMLDAHVQSLQEQTSKRDQKRGNYQTNAGFSGSQSHQKRTKENVLKYFGAAIPSLRVDTPMYLDVMKILSELAAAVGLAIMDPEFLKENPRVAEERQFVESVLGKGISLPLLSICFQKLDKVARTGRHCDSENGEAYKEVLIASKILRDANGE